MLAILFYLLNLGIGISTFEVIFDLKMDSVPLLTVSICTRWPLRITREQRASLQGVQKPYTLQMKLNCEIDNQIFQRMGHQNPWWCGQCQLSIVVLVDVSHQLINLLEANPCTADVTVLGILIPDVCAKAVTPLLQVESNLLAELIHTMLVFWIPQVHLVLGIFHCSSHPKVCWMMIESLLCIGESIHIMLKLVDHRLAMLVNNHNSWKIFLEHPCPVVSLPSNPVAIHPISVLPCYHHW